LPSKPPATPPAKPPAAASLLLAAASLLLAAIGASAAGGSTLRQPPGGAAASFDSKSFLVGDKRILLRSAGVHYFRIPPEEWADRLRLTRLAGFNMVETPVPWALHQPARGADLRLDGPADLGRFLDLCHEAGLLALVRLGPYVNAALTRGGLPAWLADDPKLLIRSSNDRYLQAVGDYWARLLPVVLKRQVPRGPVALLQLEDHYRGPDPRYLPRLYEMLRNHSVRVPVVLGELNPCRDFQQVRPTDTRFFATTELLPAGPLPWGKRNKAFDGFGNIVFEGLAKGIDGYNHPMWAAGTNLHLLQASTFPTRYEAPTCGILESGGPSPVFADVRRANCFARAFESVLTRASALAAHPLLDQGRRAGFIAYGRTDGHTALLFFKRRYGRGPLPLADPATGQSAALPTSTREFRHVVAGHPLAPGTTLAFCTAQVLAIQQFPGKRLLVVYAPEGSESVMVFRLAKRPAIRVGSSAFAWNEKPRQLTLRWKCRARGERKDFVFEAGQPIHVVALEESQVARTWLLDGAGVFIGATRLGPWTTGANTTVELRLPARRVRKTFTFYPSGPLRSIAPAKGLSEVRCDEAIGRIDFRLDLEIMEPLTLFLRKWQMADALAEAAPGFDDSRWRDTVRPEPLGEGHHGWYRCTFRGRKTATRTLTLANVADAATVFLNGQCVGQSATKRLMDGPRSFPHPAHFQLPVRRGDNVLAILVKSWGCYRNTLSYGVPLAPAAAWGILGSVAIEGQPLGRWRQHEGLDPAGRSLDWGEPRAGGSPVRWFRTTFAPRKHPARLAARVYLKGVSHGVLWLNGHYIGLYSQAGGEASQGYLLPTPWLRERNELVVLEEGGQQPTEGEVRFDRNDSYVPLRLEFRAAASAVPAPRRTR